MEHGQIPFRGSVAAVTRRLAVRPVYKRCAPASCEDAAIADATIYLFEDLLRRDGWR
jgi:hypothetical protein